jgi:hypothetical protein
MSGHNTLSIHKLADLAKAENPRLYEPLLAYALETGAADRLLSCVGDSSRKEEYLLVLGLCEGKPLLDLPEPKIGQLPWSYQKLLNTWHAIASKGERTKRSKQLRLGKTLELQKAKGVSNAQIYHVLGLNPGNTNAYLKNQDCSKLSLENTTKIMEYLYMR